jgi:hypothetical protein
MLGQTLSSLTLTKPRMQGKKDRGSIGPVWFVSPVYPTKILVMPNILLLVWFVDNYLAANGQLDISFTNSCQNFGNPWATKSCAKKLASQFW